MLFDATRRNPTVLYVTQRQNGLMVEGHREIMGSSPGDKRVTVSSRELSKSGVINHRASPGPSGRESFDGGSPDEDYQQIMDHAADQEASSLKKHPLRIDLRENNPEQMVAERLLEATEFTLPGKVMKSVPSDGGEEGSASGSSRDRVGAVRGGGGASLRPSSNQQQRPHSANMSSSSSVNSHSHRPPRMSNQYPSATGVRPSTGGPSSALTRSVGISGEGIRTMTPSRQTRGGGGGMPRGRDEDDEEIDEDEGEDDILLEGFEGENEQSSYLRSKLLEKRNERLEGGVRGAGVGSLLDTEIRKMQIQSSEALTGAVAGTAPGTGSHRLQRGAGKRLKRKVVVSAGQGGLVRRAQALPPGLSALPPPPAASSKRQQQQPMSLHERKSEMKGVYVTPVIRPIAKASGSGGHQLVKSSSGFVDRKRIVTSAGAVAAGPVTSQRVGLGLSRSAPQISRPKSAPVRGGEGAGTGGGGGMTSSLNPYTQRTLNPGILF
jgi:hypothetical protein